MAKQCIYHVHVVYVQFLVFVNTKTKKLKFAKFQVRTRDLVNP